MIMSYEFACKHSDSLRAEQWDTVVFEKAHKLRNTYKNNKTGKTLRGTFAGCKKILLSATPLQNSLMDLYGLSFFLGEHLFGDEKIFRKQFVNKNNAATERLTLKKQQRTLESKRRRQRRKIDDIEEEIKSERKRLIDVMKAKPHQESSSEQILIFRWRII